MIDIYATLARIIFVARVPGDPRPCISGALYAPYRTLAEECLNEIAAEKEQSMECRAGVYDPERHPAMGLEEFEQALGRRQRSPSSEGTPPAEAEGEG